MKLYSWLNHCLQIVFTLCYSVVQSYGLQFPSTYDLESAHIWEAVLANGYFYNWTNSFSCEFTSHELFRCRRHGTAEFTWILHCYHFGPCKMHCDGDLGVYRPTGSIGDTSNVESIIFIFTPRAVVDCSLTQFFRCVLKIYGAHTYHYNGLWLTDMDQVIRWPTI